jgi:hypothetical protein
MPEMLGDVDTERQDSGIYQSHLTENATPMDYVNDPPDHYYECEVPWLWAREWKEEDEDADREAN